DDGHQVDEHQEDEAQDREYNARGVARVGGREKPNKIADDGDDSRDCSATEAQRGGDGQRERDEQEDDELEKERLLRVTSGEWHTLLECLPQNQRQQHRQEQPPQVCEASQQVRVV